MNIRIQQHHGANSAKILLQETFSSKQLTDN